MSICQRRNLIELCRSFDTKLKQRFDDKDEAVKVYTNLISEGEQCLNVIDDALAKQKLCDQIALGYNERGLAKYHKVDFDEAVEDFTKALSYNDKLHVTFYNRGLIHYRLGRFDAAMEDMKKTLQLNADFESAEKCLEQAKIDKLKIS